MARKGTRSKNQPRPKRRRAERAAPANRKHVMAFAATTLVVLLAAAYFLWPAVKLSALFTPARTDIEIAVTMAGFSLSRIAAQVGQPVTIRLVNKDNRFHEDGGGWHQFAIDELGVNIRVAPLTTRTFTLTPKETGVFDFYCEVCCGGRANPYMHGTLTVTA